MNVLRKLFGLRSNTEASQKPGNLSSGFVAFNSDDLDRASKKMGELYFQCPNCGAYERVNDVGKVMLQHNPTYFTSINCIECNHQYNARERIQKGTIPTKK